MDNVPGSGTLKILSMANRLEEEGEDIIHLEVGQPDFDTPEHIKKSAVAALDRGETGYTSSSGKPEIKEAISESLEGKGIERDTEEIIVTPGAKHSIFTAMTVTLDPGDEIIIPSPCWTYEGMVRIINAEPVFVETSEKEGFQLNSEQVKENINPDTQMLLLNTPNNPTGAVLEEETLRTLGELALDHDFWILADEVYDRLTYRDNPPSLASLPEYEDRVIYVNSFSKTYSMTGWRLGYTAANEDVISEMIKIQQNSTTCATSFVQSAGVTALRGSQECVEEMASSYEERRDVIVDGLNSISGIECFEPEGAFYVFPNIEKYDMDSMEFCEYLLEDSGIAATPGTAFGPAGKGHIRLSYAVSVERLEEALARLEESLTSL